MDGWTGRRMDRWEGGQVVGWTGGPFDGWTVGRVGVVVVVGGGDGWME